MATLRNARHEIFAQEIVKGLSGREAGWPPELGS
jgi:hypothetical protein